jgi:predicted TIM-barrel fold metal-dependent hydrolase
MTRSDSNERLTVISADCHAGPASMRDFKPYMERKHHARFDAFCDAADAYDAAVAAELIGRGGAPNHVEDQGLFDYPTREKYLNSDGIAAEVIYLQGSIPFTPYPAVVVQQPQTAFEASTEEKRAGYRAYNRWLSDLCSNDPRRHYGVAEIPIEDIPGAVAEVEWAAANHLTAGIIVPTMYDDMPKYNNPLYEPLWAACAANNMTINMHGASTTFMGGGDEAIALTLAECDFFSHRGLWFIMFSGVFERYPNLHLAITEQHTLWVKQMLRDLDSVYYHPRSQGVQKKISRPPSEIFASNCFLGASSMSRMECDLRKETGAMMWGSDYPHLEGTWPMTRESLRFSLSPDLTSDELRDILGDNAARCYGIDTRPLRAIAERIGPTEAELREPLDVVPQGPAVHINQAFRTFGAWF